MRFKLMGGIKKMRSGVVPHIFDCQPDRKRASAQPARIAALKRVKRQLVQEAIASTSNSTQPLEEQDISNVEIKLITEGPNDEIQKKEVSTQTSTQSFPKVRSKGVQCKVCTGVSVSLSPHRIVQKHMGTSPGLKNMPILQKPDSDSDSSSYISEECSENYEDQYNSDSDSSCCEKLPETENDFQTLTLKCSIMNIEKRPRIYLGLPEYAFYTMQLLQKYCNLKHLHIFLTLKKIRTGHSFTILGDDFGISESYSSKIFAKSLPLISKYFRKCIFSPGTDTVVLNLPLAFRARYRNVFSIIDCLEIEIEKPSDAFKQSLTWSEYKKCNTIKYLISCTPDGIINFISTGFGGRTSDAIIVEYSGFLNILPPNISVMADRGFKHIEHLLVAKNSKLIRPPSVSSNTKPSKAEVLETKRIASLRIHVERVIRRLREFAFLVPHACIDNKLIPYTDQIIKIVCGLINLQSGFISGK